MNRLRLLLVCVLPISVIFSGCSRREKKDEFEPNRVLAQATKIKVGDIYPMDTALSEATTAVNMLFGTPDSPS